MSTSSHDYDARNMFPGARRGAARMEAPAGEPVSSRAAPGAGARPRICEHVVEPETWQEMHDGVVVELSPALPPHSRKHAELDFVLRGSVAPGYAVDSDLLTRTSERWNFASDSSVRKDGLDPETGCRYLEELAFEVKYTQSERELRDKAREMVARGVRRVFVIAVAGDAEGAQVRVGPVMEWLEWLAGEGGWRVIEDDALIEDPCLHQPLPVRALLDAAEADNAVVRALAKKGNPVIAQLVRDSYGAGKDEGYRSGQEEGLARLRAMLHTILAQRGIALDEEARARIEACRNADLLQTWITRAALHASATAAKLLGGD
jgi:hypothetical protein